jgi:hypothetical protein
VRPLCSREEKPRGYLTVVAERERERGEGTGMKTE